MASEAAPVNVMNEYRISGTNPHTGRRTTVVVRALNDENARESLAATGNRLEVERVDLIHPPHGSRLSLFLLSFGQFIAILVCCSSLLYIIWIIFVASDLDTLGVALHVSLAFCHMLYWAAMFVVFARAKRIPV